MQESLERIMSNERTITIRKNNYIIRLSLIEFNWYQQRNPQLTESETAILQKALGQFNWVAGMSRLETFKVCESSERIKNATISDLISLTKVIRSLKTTPSYMKCSTLEVNSLKIYVFSDASFNNLSDGGSEKWIHISMDKNKNTDPLSLNSSKVKRIFRSTLAGETLSSSEACDNAFLNSILNETVKFSDSWIIVFTGNKSLYDTAHTTKRVLDWSLRVELSAIRQMCHKGEVNVNWIED